mmetsp:Transcript_8717/g.13618  ORF Transcript_8717/g.13618 Transcript_8717/m.13618 type:complete len:92 (-) Transcript_8717:69-344(-)
MITFWPPAWHAAQLPLKIVSPLPTSPARAAPATPNVTAPVITAAPAAWGRWMIRKKSEWRKQLSSYKATQLLSYLNSLLWNRESSSGGNKC